MQESVLSHTCEAIISSRASAHRLHEVLLFDRKFIVISYQTKKGYPFGYPFLCMKKARDGTRTRGLDLGKVALHQLSHSRMSVFSRQVIYYRTGFEKSSTFLHFFRFFLCFLYFAIPHHLVLYALEAGECLFYGKIDA